jgi:hypothetical protein
MDLALIDQQSVKPIHQTALGPLVVGYGPFSLCAIHKEDLCPSRFDINRLMMKAWEREVSI